jgi:NAD(P)-dependent dehydrogenase (short-subunit alcohol dehydrogenase family)
VAASEGLFNIADRVALVTGGSGFLGRAMACGLARCHAKVVVLGRSASKVDAVVQQISGEGGSCLGVTADVTDRGACEQAAQMVLDRFGQIDFLINAAGGNQPQATASDEVSFFDLPPTALRNVVDLNLIGTIIPCQVFGRHLAQAAHGSIVNIASMAAIRPLTRVVGYSAAKAAVVNFTAWLSVYMCQTYGPDLRVNAIAPGFFLTDQNRYLLIDPQGGFTARGKSILEATPMRRFGEPDELIGTLIWLLSPAAKFITGTIIPVDGGFSAYAGV